MSYDDYEIPDVDETELVKVFQTLTNIIEKAIKESPDHGGKTLASIHFRLFQDNLDNPKNEKSRLALMYLQAQLAKMISEAGKSHEIGMLILAYTRHWLRFNLIHESKMASLYSWFTQKEVLPFNLVPYISNIDELIPINLDSNSPGLEPSIIKEFNEFADAANDDAGEELKKWLDGLMRQTMFYEEEESRNILWKFQKSASDMLNVDPFNIHFNTLFHQYGEAWFEEIKLRKKWILDMIEKLDLLKDENILRMGRGFNMLKFSGKPFSQVVQELNR